MCHYTNCKKAHSKGVTTSCGHCYFTKCTYYESSCSFIYCICVSKNDYIVYARFGVTILVALFIGLIVYYRYRERNVLKDVEVSVQKQKKSWKDVMNHTVDEFLILVSIY